MTNVVIDLTMSLDGFVAGPEDGEKAPLGIHGGEHLFDWYKGGDQLRGDARFAPRGRDREVCELMFEAYGAAVFGRRTYDLAKGWNGTHPIAKQVFVLTHRAPEQIPSGETKFTFTRSLEEAVKQAKDIAGTKNVMIGSARVAQQALAAKLVDEMWIHVAPIVLGRGLRLLDRLGPLPIEMQQIEGIVGLAATHIRYRLNKDNVGVVAK